MKLWMEEILHQLIGGFYPIIFRIFNHPRWCRISSIHSIMIYLMDTVFDDIWSTVLNLLVDTAQIHRSPSGELI